MYTSLGPSKLPCARILHGLWQTSGGWGAIDAQKAIESLTMLNRAGFTTVDLADHYGPSESLAGGLRNSLSTAGAPSSQQLQCFTKWCPSPKAYTAAEVSAALDRSCTRMQTPTLDLLQLHWWDYAARAELEGVLRQLRAQQQAGRIRELGLTNFDTAHVRFLAVPVEWGGLQGHNTPLSLPSPQPLSSARR